MHTVPRSQTQMETQPVDGGHRCFVYLLPDRLDKYVEAWAEVKAA